MLIETFQTHQPKNLSSSPTEENMSVGESEYTKNLVNALRQALEINDKLNKIVLHLTQENNQMREELDQKDDVIRELVECYNVS